MANKKRTGNTKQPAGKAERTTKRSSKGGRLRRASAPHTPENGPVVVEASSSRQDEPGSFSGPASPAVRHVRDPRLPLPGTTLVKRDRHGNARCECTVVETGVVYQGVLHRSLSAAASAAAADLGIKGQVNGFVFWQLVPAARPALNPAERLRRAAEKLRDQVAAALKAGHANDVREGICRELETHTAALRELLTPA